MKQLFSLLFQHIVQVKYFLVVVVIFAMIISIRTYLNFVAIEDAVSGVEYKTNLLEDGMNLGRFFHLSYLSSDYADYFLNHENNILLPGEVVVIFEEEVPKQNTTGDQIVLIDKKELKASQSWNDFWISRRNAIP